MLAAGLAVCTLAQEAAPGVVSDSRHGSSRNNGKVVRDSGPWLTNEAFSLRTDVVDVPHGSDDDDEDREDDR